MIREILIERGFYSILTNFFSNLFVYVDQSPLSSNVAPLPSVFSLEQSRLRLAQWWAGECLTASSLGEVVLWPGVLSASVVSVLPTWQVLTAYVMSVDLGYGWTGHAKLSQSWVQAGVCIPLAVPSLVLLSQLRLWIMNAFIYSVILLLYLWLDYHKYKIFASIYHYHYILN